MFGLVWFVLVLFNLLDLIWECFVVYCLLAVAYFSLLLVWFAVTVCFVSC